MVAQTTITIIIINIFLPLSLAINCGNPDVPGNGQGQFTSTIFNSVVTYTCDSGYALQGASSRTCQSNGEWSASVPQCNRELMHYTLGICTCFAAWYCLPYMVNPLMQRYHAYMYVCVLIFQLPVPVPVKMEEPVQLLTLAPALLGGQECNVKQVHEMCMCSQYLLLL